MVKRVLLLSSFLALTAFSNLACVGAGDALDEEPVTDESELRRTTFTRLDRATADEVADTFVATFERSLDECLAAHPTIRTVSRTNISELTTLGVMRHLGLGEALRAMLDEKGQQSARPSTLRAFARPWVMDKLAPHVAADGLVAYEGVGFLMVYDAVNETEERLSIDNAEASAGVDLAELRAQWREVERGPGWNLDSEFLRPVKVDKEPTLSEIKRHFGYGRLGMASFGWDAVDDMANAGEGPGGSPTFAPIAETLKRARGIKKRWYLVGGGREWSRNVLIVMDEKNQLWGFMMGYSV